MRCANSAHCSVPPVRAPAFTTSNSWGGAEERDFSKLSKLFVSVIVLCQLESCWRLCGAAWGMYLLVGQRVKRRHGNVEQWQNSLKRRQGGKPHVELQQVDFCQTHRNHLQIYTHTHTAFEKYVICNPTVGF